MLRSLTKPQSLVKEERHVFRSILVALDGSRSAARALDEAIAVARRDGARLTLI